jgi:hypothetical protein
MISNTLMIFGPGGIGKGQLDRLVRADALRVDPYRFRPDGPRDRKKPEAEKDMFYAHPKLRAELSSAFAVFGDARQRLSTEPAVEWFPGARATFFDVRGEWQCLLLGGLSAVHAKAEIYAPAVPVLFQRRDVRSLFGALSIVILNPVESLRSLSEFGGLKEATAENCRKRGGDANNIEKRVNSIDQEASAWREMLDLGGTEYTNWQFPEYKYSDNPTKTRLAARGALLAVNPQLETFLKSESEIRDDAATP